MKKNLMTLCLFLFATAMFAQSTVEDVIVYLKDGTTVEGLMKPDNRHPWSDQKSISIFDKSLRDAKKVKKKQKTKYKPKDVKGYEYDGRYFESKKVMIAGRGDHASTFSALPKYAFIERLEQGKINVYKAYAYPPKVVSGISFDEVYSDLRANPEYFLMKESDGKVKTMHNVNIEKWIKDAKEVSKKFANGDYGNMKRKKGKKKNKIGNFLKGQMENENPDLIITVIEAYNKEMAEK